MAFKTWFDVDPAVLFGLGAALGLALLFIFRFFRRQERELRQQQQQKKVAAAASFSSSSEVSLMPERAQALHLIMERRSITPKDFADSADSPVSAEELDVLLHAANWAPTHGKTQPWRFIVFSGREPIMNYFSFLEDWYRERRDSLPDEATRKFQTKLAQVSSSWPGRVSHLAVVAMKRRALPEKLMPEWEELCAVAMSVQNAHLMATAMGLGLFWSSHTWCKDARDGRELKAALGLEEEDKVLGALTIGRPRVGVRVRSTRAPIEERVQFKTDLY